MAKAGQHDALAQFVLDPLVHDIHKDAPARMDASLVLALRSVADGPPRASAPLVAKVALGWLTFRRQRLKPSRLFQLARSGCLQEFEQELSLYGADNQWLSAALLLGAWLAVDRDRRGADKLRSTSRTHTILAERVDAVFEQREAVFPAIDGHATSWQIDEIFSEVSRMDCEGDLERLRGLTDEVPFAKLHGETLAAFAQDDRDQGTARMHEYTQLMAANEYLEYRNVSLWELMCALVRHRDAGWVQNLLLDVVAAALAGSDRPFIGGVRDALWILQAVAEGRGRSVLEERVEDTRYSAPERDIWSETLRRFGGLAESKAVLFAEDGTRLIEEAIGSIPPGYSGFRAPACLTLAESAAICGANRSLVTEALRAARAAADKVHDTVFCARTVSRVNALEAVWWQAEMTGNTLSALVDRFCANPLGAEFAAEHFIGYEYKERPRPLPQQFADARSLAALADLYEWPLVDFGKLNPNIKSPNIKFRDGDRIHVPDQQWAPMLASFLTASVLRTNDIETEERLRLLAKLILPAASQTTTLTTVLARFLLVLKPNNVSLLKDLELAVEGLVAATEPSPKPLH